MTDIRPAKTANDSLPAHFPFAPSKSHRILACPGSKDAPEGPTNPKAEAGTIGHAAIEELFTRPSYTSLDAFLLEDDVFDKIEPLVGSNYAGQIAQATSFYADWVHKLNGEKHLERKIAHRKIPDFGGTIDCLIVKDDCLEIHDLKTGIWPAHMEQLQCYSLLARQEFPRPVVHCTIVQPRAKSGDTLQQQSWTKADLDKFEKRVARAAVSDRLKAGDHCAFCGFRPTCEVAEKANAPNRVGEFQCASL